VGDKLNPEDTTPPSKKTRDLIARNIGNRWPHLNVEVFYAWEGGQTRLYFRWSDLRGTHEVVDRFGDSIQNRIVCFMSYRAVLNEVAILQCSVCDGAGVMICTRCKGVGKTKTGKSCARCAGKPKAACPSCVRSVK
jgi:hypothetical protein